MLDGGCEAYCGGVAIVVRWRRRMGFVKREERRGVMGGGGSYKKLPGFRLNALVGLVLGKKESQAHSAWGGRMKRVAVENWWEKSQLPLDRTRKDTPPVSKARFLCFPIGK